MDKAKTKSVRFRVACMECGKRFSTTNPMPECPKCGGVDVEPVSDVGLGSDRFPPMARFCTTHGVYGDDCPAPPPDRYPGEER